MTESQKQFLRENGIGDDAIATFESRQSSTPSVRSPAQVASEEGSIRAAPDRLTQAINYQMRSPDSLANRAIPKPVGSLVRSVVSPVLATAERLFDRSDPRSFISPLLSMARRDKPYQDIIWPDSMGGNYPVKNSPLATGGDALQTAATVVPFARPMQAAMMMRPIVAPALLGGAYGVGSAMSEEKGTPQQLISGAGGAVVGAGMGVLAKAATMTKEEWQAAMKNSADYVMPKNKALKVGEQIAQKDAVINADMRALRTESGTIQQQKKDLQIQGVQQQRLGKLELEAEERKMIDAIKTQSVPKMKEGLQKFSDNMTSTYGEALDKAMEGKAISRQAYNDEVIEPILESMAMDGVPKDSAIFQKISSLVKSEAKSPVSQVANVPHPSLVAATPEQAAQAKQVAALLQAEPVTAEVPSTISAADFKHMRKSVMDGVGKSIKSGSEYAGMYDNWANEFNYRHGQFVKQNVPEMAPVIDAYPETAWARGKLWKQTYPMKEHELDGAVRLLTKIAKGEPLPSSVEAAIGIAEKGKGPIPGLGKGALTEDARKFGTIYRDTVERLKIEKESIRDQTLAIEKRMKGIMQDRAKVSMGREEIDSLRIYQRRLQRISAAERALATAGALYAVGHGGVSPIVHKALSIP